MKSETLQRILGENIAKYRTEQGMTQAYLAEMVGVSTAFSFPCRTWTKDDESPYPFGNGRCTSREL